MLKNSSNEAFKRVWKYLKKLWKTMMLLEAYRNFLKIINFLQKILKVYMFMTCFRKWDYKAFKVYNCCLPFILLKFIQCVRDALIVLYCIVLWEKNISIFKWFKNKNILPHSSYSYYTKITVEKWNIYD